MPASFSDVDPTLVRTGPSVDEAGACALPVGTRLAEFEILKLLGRGGFGIVYLAKDYSLERSIALKEYMPWTLASRESGGTTVSVRSKSDAETFALGLRSFINEARLLAQFDHPGLVKVYRFWEANGTAYMAMPYYDGKTLAQALAERRERPDEPYLLGLLQPILTTLAVLHAAKCYHRDISPDNIIITSAGPVLLDFGAARRVISDASRTFTVILKDGYAPIEQYGNSEVLRQGSWTDIYALCSVVRYAIIGEKPPASVDRLISDRMEPLAELAAGEYSDAFLRAIDSGMGVKPDDRPQSIADLRAMLGAVADGIGSEASRSTEIPQRRPGDPILAVYPPLRVSRARLTEGDVEPEKRRRDWVPRRIVGLAMVLTVLVLGGVISLWMGLFRLHGPALNTERTASAPPSPSTAVVAGSSIRTNGARQVRLDDEAYRSAVEQNAVGPYRAFLRSYPLSPHAPDIRERLASMERERQKEELESERKRQEKERQEAQREGAAYQVAIGRHTSEAYNAFLAMYAKGRYADDVRNRLGQCYSRERTVRIPGQTISHTKPVGVYVEDYGQADAGTSDECPAAEQKARKESNVWCEGLGGSSVSYSEFSIILSHGGACAGRLTARCDVPATKTVSVQVCP